MENINPMLMFACSASWCHVEWSETCCSSLRMDIEGKFCLQVPGMGSFKRYMYKAQ